MNKEIISNKQGFMLAAILMMTNSFALLFGTDAGRDVWIAYLLATVMVGLVWLLMSGMLEENPSMDFFALLDRLTGKFFGRVIAVVLAVYAFLTAATTLGIFSRFNQVTALSKTPQIIMPLLIVLIGVWAMKSGVEVLGRCANLLFYFIVFVFLYFMFFGVEFIHPRNLAPILWNGWTPVITSAGSVFINQFGESILLVAVYSSLAEKSRRRRAITGGVITGAVMVTLIAVSTTATLGQAETASEFYPVFTVLSIRNVGGFIQHMEILTSAAMAFFVFFKIALCLYFMALALKHLFGLQDFRALLLPVGLILVSFTQLSNWNMMDVRTRIEGRYALMILLPLLIALPVLLAVISRIRARREGRLCHPKK